MSRRWPIRAAIVLLAVLPLGCEFVEVVETALPPQAEAGSLFLAFERSFEPQVDVRALDLTRDEDASYALAGLSTDEEVRLTAVFYRDSLAELGLVAGPQATNPDFCFDVADVGGRAPLASFVREVGPRGEGRLGPMGEPSSALNRARFVPSVNACDGFEDTFDVETQVLAATNDSSFALRLFDGTVLLGTQAYLRRVEVSHQGTVWLLTDLGDRTQIEPVAITFTSTMSRRFSRPAGVGGEPTWTAVQMADGTLILSDMVDPWLWKAELRREPEGLTLLVTSTQAFADSDQDADTPDPEDLEGSIESHRGRYKWTQKNLPGEPEEVFALSWEGHFERWLPGESPELIHDFGDLSGILSHAGLLRLGPGEAIAGFNSSPFVVHYRNGSISMEQVAPEGGVSALGRHPSGRIYAGSPHGVLYSRSADREWSEVRDLALGIPISRIVPWRDGIIITGTNGFVARSVTPADGRERFYTCRQALGHSVRLHAFLGDEAIVFTGAPAPGRAEPVVEVLRPKSAGEPIPRCYRDAVAPSP